MTPPRVAHKGWLLGVLLVGPFMAQVDATIANVATPSIHTDLGASGAALELVIGGYLIAFAVLLITGARLGQTHGYRRVFVLGVGVFSLASLLCGVAPSPAVLVLARVLQGVGAAMMFPQTLTGIQLNFSGKERSRAIGLYAVALSTGAVAGQILGGALISANIAGSHWRAIFLINLPIGAAVIAAARRYTANHGLPLINVEILARPAIRWGLLTLLAATGTYYALLFTLAQYLQQGLAESPLVSGLTLVPWVAAFGLAGQLVRRLPPRAIPLAPGAGCVLLTASYTAISAALFTGYHGEALLVPLLGVGGLGLGVQFSALIAHLTKTVPDEYAPDISGVSTTAIQIGGAIGVAGFGTLYLSLNANPGIHQATHAFAVTTAAFAGVALLATATAYRSTRQPTATHRHSATPKGAITAVGDPV